MTHSFEHGAPADMDRTEAIRKMAYERWDAEGRPDGRDLVHWLEAEQFYLTSITRGDGAPAMPLTHRPRGFRPRTAQTGAQKNG